MSFITSITKGRKKTPEQLVRLAARDLSDLDADQTAAELKAGISPHEDLCKRLSQIKVILYGDGDKAEVDEEKVVDVSRRIQDVCYHSASLLFLDYLIHSNTGRFDDRINRKNGRYSIRS